jgi:hypothetical protein
MKIKLVLGLTLMIPYLLLSQSIQIIELQTFPQQPSTLDSIQINFGVGITSRGGTMGYTFHQVDDTIFIFGCYFIGFIPDIGTFYDSITLKKFPIGKYYVYFKAMLDFPFDSCINWTSLGQDFQDSIISFTVTYPISTNLPNKKSLFVNVIPNPASDKVNIEVNLRIRGT